MTRDIRYARTSDGVSIAYSVSGSGPAIISMPFLPFTTLEGGGSPSPARVEFESVVTVVDYDSRGFGLSDTSRTDLSVETLAMDLAAVALAAELQQFDLIAISQMAMPAVWYTARNPELVRRLLLVMPATKGSHFWSHGRTQAFRALRQADWETYKDVIAQTYRQLPSSLGMIGEVSFKGVSEEAVGAYMDGLMAADVTDDLKRIQTPTLVIHLELGAAFIAIDVAREVASTIPTARLAVAPGSTTPDQGVFGLIADFLGVPLSSASPAPAVPAAFKTIMFTDLEGSTTLTQRLGDAGAQGVVRSHDEIVRRALAGSGGREIKHTGDGIMAAFDSASRAIECAIAIQREVAANNLAARVRIGINAGEPVAEGDDLFGTAVQLARRICDAGDGGDIIVANVVRELAAGKGFAFADRGETLLKGFEDAAHLYTVSWSE